MIDGVEAALIVLSLLPVEAGAGGDVELATDDGLHAGRPCLLVELDGSEEIAVVRLGDRRHGQSPGSFKERRVLDGTVEKRVLRM